MFWLCVYVCAVDCSEWTGETSVSGSAVVQEESNHTEREESRNISTELHRSSGSTRPARHETGVCVCLIKQHRRTFITALLMQCVIRFMQMNGEVQRSITVRCLHPRGFRPEVTVTPRRTTWALSSSHNTLDTFNSSTVSLCTFSH